MTNDDPEDKDGPAAKFIVQLFLDGRISSRQCNRGLVVAHEIDDWVAQAAMSEEQARQVLDKFKELAVALEADPDDDDFNPD